jgi:hypothetical protein
MQNENRYAESFANALPGFLKTRDDMPEYNVRGALSIRRYMGKQESNEQSFFFPLTKRFFGKLF